jgi:hypothetical protein
MRQIRLPCADWSKARPECGLLWARRRAALPLLASFGIGQEINLPKGTKLELVLDQPLYLTQYKCELYFHAA